MIESWCIELPKKGLLSFQRELVYCIFTSAHHVYIDDIINADKVDRNCYYKVETNAKKGKPNH